MYAKQVTYVKPHAESEEMDVVSGQAFDSLLEKVTNGMFECIKYVGLPYLIYILIKFFQL
ncbi:hypothetical protein V1503_22070 [Bacillus sp. SCS-151]|uniref:hypothetical protein n=1 Tax=Nanhaiella sioensis TaxID=3115293 RepID=UPI003979779C